MLQNSPWGSAECTSFANVWKLHSHILASAISLCYHIWFLVIPILFEAYIPSSKWKRAFPSSHKKIWGWVWLKKISNRFLSNYCSNSFTGNYFSLLALPSFLLVPNHMNLSMHVFELFWGNSMEFLENSTEVICIFEPAFFWNLLNIELIFC